MPRIIAVGQAFKGSLSAVEVTRALAAGAEAAGVGVEAIVGSDGGDGLLDAIAPPHRTLHRVTGPMGTPVEAAIGWVDAGTAVIESRLACGVAFLPFPQRNPERATTRGVGELLEAAIAGGARQVVVGLGGSATMDGGLGAARAWGWRALDARGRDLPDHGGALQRLASLVPAEPLPVQVLALADVANRLLGLEGAAVYARQKGARAAARDRLMGGLERLVSCAAQWDGPSFAEQPGAGAAGGLGFGLLCFARARLEPGASWIMDRAGFEDRLPGADLVIIAEATLDATSFAGKLTGTVLDRARSHGVPAVVVTPRARTRPPDVTVIAQPGRWSSPDLSAMAERAVRETLRLP
ncbi:MAG: glycerate kinase [Gemmatimonadota bacterium]|nr:glycerate kinase [Gemmatimonadota bacterium]MDH4350737.1 glycerate kinase [Gemmatimonadota bacterium]